MKTLYAYTILATALFFSNNTLALAQAGKILVASSPAASPMNPNGDTWATSCACAYASKDDGTESEIPFTKIFQLTAEPSGDLSGGGSCGTTDIMDSPSTGADASYVYYKDPNGVPNSGDEYVIYRLRVGKNPGTANFGFSVLMDTDGKIGRADANYIAGNPGFEREIRVVNGGGSKGVYVDNIDGRTSGINLKSYSLTSNTQRVSALYTTSGCGTTDVIFYDFYVMLSDMGVSSTAPIRLVGATSVNGSTVLSAGASDIGGTNDNLMSTFGGSAVSKQDSMFVLLVKAQPVVTFETLPVNLLYFKAQTKSNQTQLLWATASEQNNDYFSIEKSENGKDFTTIGTVQGAGNSQKTLSYEYTDRTPLYQKTYYRLKQIDFDGAFKYSPTVAVAADKDIIRNLNVSVNNKNVTDFELSAEEDFRGLRVLDMLGREINIGQDYNNTDGYLQITLPNDSQQHPIYILSVSTTRGTYSRKIRLN
ncbi:hypothetical protein SAMN05421780_101481 [Flexibacter flexilis DSM 6793]|uniref:Por secretion system C-terminal sorting domain-containing protein n=1 Tax=Flexibacter flexilis DSM 6793 TaxID=927664 RepID=A0A1I1DWH2_9BACT|nr:hypothetical protein [Flexibacter flexilis]SFB78756.1 hypothetical protein SAMN05421780_101481 [Flexibacter flexilis DSM 6793]